MGWRNKIYDTIETERNSIISKIYDWSMLFFIVISIIPLAFREQNVWLEWFDKVSVTVFIVDYLLRWLTADLRMNNRPKWVAFLTYPFSAFAIVDLLSILPSVAFVNKECTNFVKSTLQRASYPVCRIMDCAILHSSYSINNV